MTCCAHEGICKLLSSWTHHTSLVVDRTIEIEDELSVAIGRYFQESQKVNAHKCYSRTDGSDMSIFYQGGVWYIGNRAKDGKWYAWAYPKASEREDGEYDVPTNGWRVYRGLSSFIGVSSEAHLHVHDTQHATVHERQIALPHDSESHETLKKRLSEHVAEILKLNKDRHEIEQTARGHAQRCVELEALVKQYQEKPNSSSELEQMCYDLQRQKTELEQVASTQNAKNFELEQTLGQQIKLTDSLQYEKQQLEQSAHELSQRCEALEQYQQQFQDVATEQCNKARQMEGLLKQQDENTQASLQEHFQKHASLEKEKRRLEKQCEELIRGHHSLEESERGHRERSIQLEKILQQQTEQHNSQIAGHDLNRQENTRLQQLHATVQQEKQRLEQRCEELMRGHHELEERERGHINRYSELEASFHQQETRKQVHVAAQEAKLQGYVQRCQALENEKAMLESALSESNNRCGGLEKQLQQKRIEAKSKSDEMGSLKHVEQFEFQQTIRDLQHENERLRSQFSQSGGSDGPLSPSIDKVTTDVGGTAPLFHIRPVSQQALPPVRTYSGAPDAPGGSHHLPAFVLPATSPNLRAANPFPSAGSVRVATYKAPSSASNIPAVTMAAQPLTNSRARDVAPTFSGELEPNQEVIAELERALK